MKNSGALSVIGHEDLQACAACRSRANRRYKAEDLGHIMQKNVQREQYIKKAEQIEDMKRNRVG